MPDLAAAEQVIMDLVAKRAEQVIMDLVAKRGPMTDEQLWVELGASLLTERGVDLGLDLNLNTLAPEFIAAHRALLSRGLLLERERTVECGRCEPELVAMGMPGKRSIPSKTGRLIDCSHCDGTGSVKERVIGRPCRTCGGDGRFNPVEDRGDELGRLCPRCSSTPTPGLDPGAESEAR